MSENMTYKELYDELRKRTYENAWANITSSDLFADLTIQQAKEHAEYITVLAMA